MLRRKPTRVELTTDDVQDYEALKKKAEEAKKKKEGERLRAAKAAEKASKSKPPTPAKEASRREVVASRIGLRTP